MRSALLIARRELSAYLRTMSGYIIIAIALLVDGLLFNVFALGVPAKRLSSEVLNSFFYLTSGVSLFAAVFISMRLLAEERQTGTISLLYSSPVRDGEIVLGKFLSALAFLAIMILATVFMPALILVNGKISFGHIVAGYLGLLLLGSAALAIGIFASALAKSQIVAAIISGCLLVFLVACWLLARVTERPLSEIFTAMALHNQHFQPFQAGLVHIRDIVYYLAITYLSLFAATRVLEARRWR
ncbi:MAG TPA: ABC transporter permease [Myxococcaceae bacterium]|nr:ABC transporter permease [Myxococcaceae bacterium]